MPATDPAALFADPDKPAVLSVTSLNRLAKSLLESNFPTVTVEGEISNLARPASGHWYLSLKDKHAQIRCAMFAGRNRLVRFRPDNGQQVVVRGRLSIYEARGDYQLIVESMEEAGDGALRRAFEELKAKLQAEGLFDAAGKQAVRNNYRHIGLITSGTGAALRDLLTVFRRRFPATRLTLLPVAVQGSQAPGEIVRAIAAANRLRDRLGLEALIVGRGGGSLEDLQAFNEEAVARAIHASDLPVVSAVGHEIDFTIADFVADLRAPTPSAAAELLSPSRDEYADQFAGYAQLLGQQWRNYLNSRRQTLAGLARHLQRPDRRLQEHAQTLDRLEQQLRRNALQQLRHRRETVDQLQRSLRVNSPVRALARLAERSGDTRRRLRQAALGMLQAQRVRLAALGRGLNAVSPLQTLARGYSITFDARGRVLRQAADAAIGQRIMTRLDFGRLTATVETIEGADDEAADD
ncbi:MAG: exodeoxyribonuclease VII large subunit [Pseudohongiellaceae bacterium]